MSKVWLVTGSASGLGRNIAEEVLTSGARLLATARDPRRLDDLAKKYGDQISHDGHGGAALNFQPAILIRVSHRGGRD